MKNSYKILLLIIVFLLSIFILCEYGNKFLAINIFNYEQVAGNISDMNCLLKSPLKNIINDFNSLINISTVPSSCELFYTKFSYIKNLLIYISFNFILLLTLY